MAGVLRRRLLAALLGDVGDQQQLGIVGVTIPRQGVVPVELAEAAAEGDVLLARNLLVAEQQDAAFQELRMDLVEFVVAERLGEIDALDLGAERVGQRSEGEAHGPIIADLPVRMQPDSARVP